MHHHIIAALLLSGSGSLLFIQVYNRVLLHMKHGRLKSAICYTAMLLFPGIPMLIGFQIGKSAISIWTITVFLLLVSLELFQRVMRSRLRKTTPEEKHLISTNKPVSSLFRNTTYELIMRRFSLRMDDWTGPTLRIAHLSDFHIDKFKELDFLYATIRELQKLRPDIVFLTGDYTDKIENLDKLESLLGKIHAPLGVFGCLGNHDYWADPDQISRSLRNVGITIPPEEGITLVLSKDSRLRIYRSDYPYVKPWSFNAQTKDPSSLDIVLSHTPDYYKRLESLGADLVFSGHLHGGQWRIPLFGSVIAPSIRDRLFDMGHFTHNNTHIFVTAGVGNVWFPYRVNCPAEILCLDLSGHPDRCSSIFEASFSSLNQIEPQEVMNTAR